jgi:catechol 2,3-dioxygenase-like lactoylglutathione lyase family enzyme
MAPVRPAGVLINVKDLGRSTDFYVDVLGFEVETSDADIVVLGGGELHFVTLRRAPAGALQRGRDSLGARALFWEVVGRAELDRVEEQLRVHKAFTSRSKRADGGETVLGLDPDYFALAFVGDVPDKPFRSSAIPTTFYSVDA